MTWKRVLNLAITLAVLTALALSGVVWADNVVNTIDNTIDNQKEEVLVVRGGWVKVGFKIIAVKDKDEGSAICNVDASNPATLSFQDLPTGISADTATFTACGEVKEVTFSVNSQASLGVNNINTNNFNMSGGKPGASWDFGYAQFQINVIAPSDTTPPVITYEVIGTEGNNGWYVSDVTVKWTVTDNESIATIVEGCVDTTITTDTSGRTLTCKATSAGGTASQSVTIKRDATPPTITAALDKSPASTGWFNASTGAPKVSFTCSDNLSGLVGDCPAAYTFGEGENQSYSQTIYDKAGNSASAGVSDIDVDLTAPTITATRSPEANTYGWNNTDVTVSFNCNDALSEIAECTTPVTLSGEGAGQSVTGTAKDKAGNTASATVSGINIDKTPPTISATLDKSPASTGWFNASTGAPTVSFTCSDNLSGLVGDCPADYTFGEGKGQSYSQTIYDKAGNSASAEVSDIDVDLTAPTITWKDFPASFVYGYPPSTAPWCEANDILSGPDTCVVTGYDPFAIPGTYTLTATAKDKAGNITTETRTYTVLAWTLKGFYQPVDMNGVFNVVKGGSTVPLKFEIFAGATELTDTAAVYALKYGETVCNANAVTDEIETVATGGTSLRYDWIAGQFIFNWKTPTTPGKCYRVTLTTQDGSSLQAFFKIK